MNNEFQVGDRIEITKECGSGEVKVGRQGEIIHIGEPRDIRVISRDIRVRLDGEESLRCFSDFSYFKKIEATAAECICEPYDIFNFGCKCGFVAKQKKAEA